ncbi:hypothetical protein [Lacinutrix sp. MEBiC02404]
MKIRNTKFKLLLSLMIAMGTLFTSCDPNEDNESYDPGENNEIGLDLGQSVQHDFMGRIVDESNAPIENVMVSIGSKMESTDANGMFIISNANVKKRQAFIVAEKPGYLKGMQSLVPTQGTNTVRLMLVPLNVIATVSSGGDSQVNLPNGTTVKFDGAFKDENGNAYSGNVDVIMYHLDPSNPDIDAIMPGNLQAENTNGEERILESYGMLNVELRGTSGQELNIADGHIAIIEMAVDPAQSDNAPATIPLWHFDEVKGYWIEDGEATLIGGKYVGEVSHFSWWNCDAQFPTVTLCLNVVDVANIPLSNVKVALFRGEATYPRIGISNGNGEICGLIPANETMTLNIFDQCGVVVYTTTIGPFSTDTSYGNLVLPTVSAAVITGNLVNCSSANVTNGYAGVTYGNQYATVDVTNGSFSLSVIECASLSGFTLEGVDFDTFQTTTALPFTFNNTNVGNIIACSTVTEFISVRVDNNPTDYFLASINAGGNQPSPGLSVSSQTNLNYFFVGLNDTTLGNYSLDQFGFESSNLNIDYAIPTSLQLNLSNYGSAGNYIDATINGTYTDTAGNVRNLSVTIHVIRDI